MAAAPKRGLPEKRRMRHDRHYVDELTQRMGEGIGRMVRLNLITSNQDQPRSSLGDLSDLVSSIENHGVLEPLLVRKREGGKYELVSGERRFHAAMKAGLDEVPCIELEVSDEHALEIAGFPRVRLRVSADAPLAHWVARLEDVQPDGRRHVERLSIAQRAQAVRFVMASHVVRQHGVSVGDQELAVTRAENLACQNNFATGRHDVIYND